MAPSPDDFQPTPAPVSSSYARDRGLRRSRRTTRWIAVTAAAGAAALGGFYTHVLPGGSSAPASANAPVQNPAASTAAATGQGHEEREEPNGYEDDTEGAAPVTQPTPQPPAQPPAATQQQPHTTTGAS
ncbi:hypothetical protein ACWDG1_44365 [Streptomyces sp. NPDC001177]